MFKMFSALFFGLLSFQLSIVALEINPNTLLIVSNSPESITEPGVISNQPLSNHGARILYHHRNLAPNRMDFVVILTNKSNQSTTINLYKGMGGPTHDIVFSGHIAAKNFLLNLQGTANVIQLGPFETKLVHQHVISPTKTTSGIVSLRKRTDAKVHLKLAIIDPDYPQLSILPPIGIPHYLPGIYEESLREQSIRFDTKTKIQKFEMGGKPYIKDRDIGFELKGNYGLFYKYKIKLVNSLKKPQRVRLMFEPIKDGAVDRGVLLIDNELKEIGVLSFKNEVMTSQRVNEFVLQPKQEKSFEVISLPQAGCYYPIQFVFDSYDVKK